VKGFCRQPVVAAQRVNRIRFTHRQIWLTSNSTKIIVSSWEWSASRRIWWARNDPYGEYDEYDDQWFGDELTIDDASGPGTCGSDTNATQHRRSRPTGPRSTAREPPRVGSDRHPREVRAPVGVARGSSSYLDTVRARETWVSVRSVAIR
jgi:hypothetical protein